MKAFNYFLPACILAMCASLFAACGSDDDNENEPPPDLGTTGFITSIADPNVTSYFEYDKGVMTKGNDGYYGDFTIQRNPLLIASRYEDNYELTTLDFKEIRTNDKGYITSALIITKETSYSDNDHYETTGRITAEYDKDGYLTKLEQKATDGGGSLTCTWVKGNLVKLQHTWEWKTKDGKIDDAGSEIYTLTYPEDAPVNSGIYVMGESIVEAGFPDFLWYAGLLGKPTKNLPTIIKGEYRYWSDYSSSPETRTETDNYHVTYDNKGRVNVLYKENRPYLAVAYDGATAVLPKN